MPMKDYSPVVGYPNYLINREGSVFSIKRNKFLKHSTQSMGYLTVRLTKTTKDGINALLHRLVAKAHIPNELNKPFVNHKNGIKTDNRVENLEWVTPRENFCHARDVLGHHTSGENNYAAKLNNFDVLMILLAAQNKIVSEDIAQAFNVNRRTIDAIRNGINWREVTGLIRTKKNYNLCKNGHQWSENARHYYSSTIGKLARRCKQCDSLYRNRINYDR